MKAKYLSLPKLSPYLSFKNYKVFKEVHKFYIEELSKKLGNKKYNLLDVGCANGQLLFQIIKKFPNLKCFGTDPDPQFISTAKKFKGLEKVNFKTCGLYRNKGSYDFVFCTSVFQIFQEYEKPLKKLLSLVKKDGYLFVDGLFNTYDVEVRLKFCDNSNRYSKNIWRRDWSQHSIKLVTSFLENEKINKFIFKKVPMEKNIKHNKKIHINQHTFRTKNNSNLITNGTNLILNKKLLIIKK